MALPDKELEDRLIDIAVKIASPPSAAADLLPLLDQAFRLLSRVDQSPPQSMIATLRPAMSSLVAKDLLDHPDVDVRVHLTACLSELTRITAPTPPYDDHLIKTIFRMIVESFAQLDDMLSPSYWKRVMILETAAKVQSCLMMLDLQCDKLVVQMFGGFLKCVRPDHPEVVFASMEMIMTLILEECDDIPPELLSCLRKEGNVVLPAGRRLRDRVISNCATKLEPYLTPVQI